MCAEIVMHTAAAEWECGLIAGRRKKLRQGEIHREMEWVSESELGCGWEPRAVGSRSVQLSQAWLILEAVKIHLLPAHYNFILQPEAHELRMVIIKHSVKVPRPRKRRPLSCLIEGSAEGRTISGIVNKTATLSVTNNPHCLTNLIRDLLGLLFVHRIFPLPIQGWRIYCSERDNNSQALLNLLSTFTWLEELREIAKIK